MKNQTATAMALVLVAGVLGLGAAPGAATDANCHESLELTYNQVSSQLTLDNSNEVEIGKVEVPVFDPDTGLPIVTARVEIDVVSGSGDVAWSIYELDGEDCRFVTSGSSASSSPDAEVPPDAIYLVKGLRASGTSSVDLTMFVGT